MILQEGRCHRQSEEHLPNQPADSGNHLWAACWWHVIIVACFSQCAKEEKSCLCSHDDLGSTSTGMDKTSLQGDETVKLIWGLWMMQKCCYFLILSPFAGPSHGSHWAVTLALKFEKLVEEFSRRVLHNHWENIISQNTCISVYLVA